MEDKLKNTKTCKKKEIELTSGNTDYINQNLEFMKFIRESKCKTKAVKNGRK